MTHLISESRDCKFPPTGLFFLADGQDSAAQARGAARAARHWVLYVFV